jgi:hypothetical protein
MTNWAINPSVHTEFISPITCKYTVPFKIYESWNGFPYAPWWYNVLVTTQGNFKHYEQFKNIIKQYQRYISFMDQKSIILSFLFTYVNTTLNNSSTILKPDHPFWIPLTELMLFSVWSITIIILSYTWYIQNIVHMNASILETNS